MVTRNQLKDRYGRLNERIAAAAERSGRRASDIMTVAVTKLASPTQIRQLVELGHQDLGESRVQQLQQRAATLEEFLSRHRMLSGGRKSTMPAHVRWHMIGHLQRNKVKPTLPLVKLIHSVDSLRLAEEIQTHAARADRDVEVLLQVNASGESQKFGLAPPAVPHLAEQIMTMLHVKVRGLMTIGPLDDDPESARPAFERAAELFNEMKTDGHYGRDFNILSMGMSEDFEIAIECGANLLRIGKGLFGEPVGASQ
jgi:hypothetical protein